MYSVSCWIAAWQDGTYGSRDCEGKCWYYRSNAGSVWGGCWLRSLNRGGWFMSKKLSWMGALCYEE